MGVEKLGSFRNPSPIVGLALEGLSISTSRLDPFFFIIIIIIIFFFFMCLFEVLEAFFRESTHFFKGFWGADSEFFACHAQFWIGVYRVSRELRYIFSGLKDQVIISRKYSMVKCF